MTGAVCTGDTWKLLVLGWRKYPYPLLQRTTLTASEAFSRNVNELNLGVLPEGKKRRQTPPVYTGCLFGLMLLVFIFCVSNWERDSTESCSKSWANTGTELLLWLHKAPSPRSKRVSC